MSDSTAFTAVQLRALAHVLDDIVPPSHDGRLPGAGAVGVGPYLDAALDAMPPLKAMIAGGLDALDAMARARDPRGLDGLDAAARAAVLAEHAASEHSFPPILMMQAFAGYYQQPAVMLVLGIPPRPPHPQGYAMEADDLEALLEPVRQRGRKYRNV